jgi:hypothetical protein
MLHPGGAPVGWLLHLVAGKQTQGGKHRGRILHVYYQHADFIDLPFQFAIIGVLFLEVLPSEHHQLDWLPKKWSVGKVWKSFMLFLIQYTLSENV